MVYLQQLIINLLWCLDANGNLPANRTIEQAIYDSKNMNACRKIAWRISYEARKSASIFSLDSIAEKVILHFAAIFRRYVAVEQARRQLDTATLATTFFGNCYSDMVVRIQGHYAKREEMMGDAPRS